MKHFCPDFQPVRRMLRDIGAILVEEKEQIDYFFSLPNVATTADSRRLKLRIENQQPRYIYYYDRNQSHTSLVMFQIFEIHDLVIKDVLEAVLGIQTVVQKHREVWRKENTIFNLDQVREVGNIFEVEIELDTNDNHEQQAAHYKRLFLPYLGPELLNTSNEDLLIKKGP